MNEAVILISNDDGIFSDGIFSLWEDMTQIGKTIVVAPNSQKSAAGHGITLSDPIRFQKIKRSKGFVGYSVQGTPADSVKIALKEIMSSKPNLVISGINSGANVGKNLFYSGTIAAASEGTFLGISSIAISLDCHKECDFSGAKSVALKLVSTVLKNGLPEGTLLNVNVPNISKNNYKGYQITKQGGVFFKDDFNKRKDPHGRFYYWMKGVIENPDIDKDWDGVALKNGYVSITPLHLKMTDHKFINELRDWNLS